jgi:hypothetical protein
MREVYAAVLALALVIALSQMGCGDEERRAGSTTNREVPKEAKKLLEALEASVDAGDAFRLARRWAKEHQRPGERFETEGCGEMARTVDLDPKTEMGFECRVRLEKGKQVRRVRLDMRSFNDSMNLKIVRTIPCEVHKLPCTRTLGATG